MNYFEATEGKKFNEIFDDGEAQEDLINFFTSSRYNYGKKELMDLGPEGLADKFIDHMRWQETNEATVAKDLRFVGQSRKEDTKGLESFGRLITAWDNSEGAGTGILDGAGDYLSAFAASPSTIATVLSAGFAGPASKITAAGAKKAGQMLVRKNLTDILTKQVAKSAVKDRVTGAVVSAGTKTVVDDVARAAAKETVKKSLIRGGLQGAAISGTFGGGMAYGQEEIREESIEGYEKNMGFVAAGAAISGALGGGLGAFARTQSVKKQNRAIDILAGQSARIKKSETTALKNADEMLEAAKKSASGDAESETFKNLRTRIGHLGDLLNKKEQGRVRKYKKALPEELVEAGEEISRKVFEGSNSDFVTARLTTGVFKRVAAATLELGERLNFNMADDVRITQKVMEAISSRDDFTVDTLMEIKKKYGLTKDEFSLVYLSDVSEAGRTLNFQSQIARGLSKPDAARATEEAKVAMEGVLDNLDQLSREGITGPADETLRRMTQNLSSGSFVNALREIDSFRVGMMTTQLATTAANVGSSGLRLGVDFSDQFFYNMVRGKNPLAGTLDVVKALSWGAEESQVVRALATLDPESQAAKMFNDVTRLETEMGSNSILSRATRAANFANTLTDTVFKSGAFTASLQRQIRDSGDRKMGRTLEEFLTKGTGLESLPEGMLERARRDSLGFSFQWGYEGAEDLYGVGARKLLDFNRKAPFVVSSVLPFPRYVANQIEFMHRHLPTGLAQGLWEKASGNASQDLFIKTDEKIAQGLTGTTMLLAAYFRRYNTDEQFSYREGPDPVSGDTRDYGRLAGAYMAHEFIGEVASRINKGLPAFGNFKDTSGELIKIATGLNAYGYQNSVITSLVESINKGEATPDLARWAGDFTSTLTMPAATVRDVVGQFDPDAAPSPYTRDLELSAGTNNAGGSIGESEFGQRALRFLPDTALTQFAASLNGKKDVPLYGGFGGGPVRKVDPLLSQITGIDTRRKKNPLQMEMSRLKIEPWRVLSARKIKNPNVDEMVRRGMDEGLPSTFDEWRETARFGNSAITYDKLPVKAQKLELDRFLKLQVGQYEDRADALFQKLVREKPRAAAGYIVNNYAIQKKRIDKQPGGVEAVITFGLGKSMTEEEYLGDSESVPERLRKLQDILHWSTQKDAIDRASRSQNNGR